MLEQEIAKLSENIQYLNKLLEAMADSAKATHNQVDTSLAVEPVKELEQTPEPEKVVTEGANTFTHDDVKALAMAISRKDRSKRDAIKEKLSEYGAKVATDLSEADTQSACEWLTALKEEVGA